MQKLRLGIGVGAVGLVLVLATLGNCSDAAKSEGSLTTSAGQAGDGPSSPSGGAGGDGPVPIVGGAGGDVAGCDCGNDPEFFHVSKDCDPQVRNVEEELSFILDPTHNALDWPSLVVRRTCASGYEEIRVSGGCEFTDSVLFDAQGRRLVKRSDPDATKLCAAHGSDTGTAYDSAEICESCTVAWHADGAGGEGGAGGAGAAYSDLDCYGDEAGPFPACGDK